MLIMWKVLITYY